MGAWRPKHVEKVCSNKICICICILGAKLVSPLIWWSEDPPATITTCTGGCRVTILHSWWWAHDARNMLRKSAVIKSASYCSTSVFHLTLYYDTRKHKIKIQSNPSANHQFQTCCWLVVTLFWDRLFPTMWAHPDLHSSPIAVLSLTSLIYFGCVRETAESDS